MATQLPYGAAEIVALRSSGKRPADALLISFVGPLRENNPVIVAQASRSYDWRFVVALPVVVIAETTTPRLGLIVKALEGESPLGLSVWFADRQDGVNILIDGYRPRTKTGRRMGPQQRAILAGLGSASGRAECLRQIAGQVKARSMANTDCYDAALLEMATSGFRHIFGTAWGAAA